MSPVITEQSNRDAQIAFQEALLQDLRRPEVVRRQQVERERDEALAVVEAQRDEIEWLQKALAKCQEERERAQELRFERGQDLVECRRQREQLLKDRATTYSLLQQMERQLGLLEVVAPLTAKRTNIHFGEQGG